MIEIEGLGKSFGKLEVLKDISLTIEDGDIYGLVGVSGAGKSTLLRCINGLEQYDSGSLKIDGVEVGSLDNERLRHLRKDIAMIFQHFDLMSRKTVYENIAFPMRCWKYPKESIDKRVRELAELVGITDKLEQKPSTLSGGQKQRVAIARALAMEPKILLSDEATSALDPISTKAILDLLKSINKEFGITIIFVTHEMSVVRSACRNISLLENGRITASGPVRTMFAEQPEAFARFLGDTSDMPAEGCSLRVVVPGNDRSVLSRMGRELGSDFALVSGSMERYGDEQLGMLVLNFDDDDVDNAKRYLDSRGIEWHECPRGDAL